MSKSNTLTRGKAIAFLLLYFLGYLLVLQGFVEPYLFLHYGNTIRFLVDSIFDSCFLLFFLFFSRKYYVSQWYVFHENCKKNWLYVFASLLCLLFTNIFLSNFVSLFLPNTIADNQVGNDALLHANTLYYVLHATIFAPFIEETIFRGCIFAKIREKHSFLFSACISGAIFGFFHIVASLLVGNWRNCIFFLVYGACGFVLCIPYEDTGSLFASVSTHSLNNFLLTMLKLWMK